MQVIVAWDFMRIRNDDRSFENAMNLTSVLPVLLKTEKDEDNDEVDVEEGGEQQLYTENDNSGSDRKKGEKTAKKKKSAKEIMATPGAFADLKNLQGPCGDMSSAVEMTK